MAPNPDYRTNNCKVPSPTSGCHSLTASEVDLVTKYSPGFLSSWPIFLTPKFVFLPELQILLFSCILAFLIQWLHGPLELNSSGTKFFILSFPFTTNSTTPRSISHLHFPFWLIAAPLSWGSFTVPASIHCPSNQTCPELEWSIWGENLAACSLLKMS